MHLVMGATGNIGGHVADTLLRRGLAVTVITRSPKAAAHWTAKGATASVVDIADTAGLHAVFQRARRAYLLNPPATPDTDTVAVERHTLSQIIAAARGADLERVVVQSTYGARPGTGCGDLNVLHEFEQAAAKLFPTTILRAGFYMSNWLPFLGAIRQGVLPVPYPADLRLPMVAPCDIGRLAADLLISGDKAGGIHYIEGPRRHTVRDVADAFGDRLNIAVHPAVTPRTGWEQAFLSLGFSPAAAESYTRMTEVIVDETYDVPPNPHQGTTTLRSWVDSLPLQDPT